MHIHLEWGLTGASRAVTEADAAVVIDVLSFTTTTSVALDAGASVVPLRWRDARAEDIARRFGADLAVGRSRTHPSTSSGSGAGARSARGSGSGRISLSPASMRAHVRDGQVIALPSPNGATIAHAIADTTTCVAGCLRNAGAVAGWLRDSGREHILVVAAGEHWPDDTLRPAVEDLWGAGAVISALVECGPAMTSPEAAAGMAAHRAVDDLHTSLHECVSGRELDAMGFGEDVDIAAEADMSTVVPLLRAGVFVDATTLQS